MRVNNINQKVDKSLISIVKKDLKFITLNVMLLLCFQLIWSTCAILVISSLDISEIGEIKTEIILISIDVLFATLFFLVLIKKFQSSLTQNIIILCSCYILANLITLFFFETNETKLLIFIEVFACIFSLVVIHRLSR